MKRAFLLPIIILLFTFACSSKKTALKDTPVFEPEALLQQANEKIKQKDYEGARAILQDIKAKDASKKYATIAQIKIGDTYFEEESYEEALVEYSNFLDVHPHHKYAPYAQYQLALTYFKQIDSVDTSYSMSLRALREFEKLQRLYPRNPYMDVIESRIKMCKSILAEYELYVGKFYFKKGSYNAAAGRFRELIEKYPNTKNEPDALYHLAVSYNHLGDKDKALDVFNTLLSKYPTNKLSNDAKKLIASINTGK